MTELEIILAGAQFAGALAAAVIALVAWRQRAQPGSLPLTLLMLSVLVWAASAGAKIIAGPSQQNTWQAVEILGAGVSSVLYLVFILEYARQQKLIRRATMHLLWFVPVAAALLAYTNERHLLFWKPLGASGTSLFLVFLLYYYALRLIATAILARAILGLSPTSRAQAWMLTLGALAPWLSNFAQTAIAPSEQFSPNGLELHPLAYALSGLVLGWGILRYRILEIVPLARDLVLEHLRDAIFTLDGQNRIVDLNPAAQAILGVERKDAFGQVLTDVLPPFHPLRELILNSAIRQQVHIPVPFDRHYEVENIPVTDKHGQERGWLIVLHDITERKQVEEDLLRSQETLDNILKTAPFPLAITTLEEGRIRYANPVGIEFYELQGKNLAEFQTFRFYDNVTDRQKLVEQIKTSQKVDGIELHMRTAGGKSRWVISSFRKIIYQGEECLLVAQTDISERKKVEEELHKGRAQLKLIFDYAGLGIRVTDRYGRYQFVNDRWAAMLAVEPTELIGQEEAMFLHPNHIFFNREQHRALIQREIEQYHIENQYINAQGECFWGEITVSPSFNEKGQVESAIGFILDITKRKQAEMALRETERRFREILENIHLLAIMLDSEGNVTFCNNHFIEMTGWEREEILGQNWFEIFIKDNQGDARRNFSRAVTHGTIVSRHETTISSRSGQSLIISWTNIALKDASGQSIGMASLGLDITERRRAHEAEREQRLLAETLTRTAEILTSSLEFGEILQLILENVGQVVPHDAANISLIEGQYVHYTGIRGYENFSISPKSVKQLKFKYKEIHNLREMYITKKPIVIPYTLQDPGWAKIPEALWIQSYVGAPIIIKDKVVGFLSLDSATPGFFTEKHAMRLAAFSVQAAIAIENARLFGKMQQSLNERRKAQQSLRRVNKRLETKIAEIEQLQAQLREQAIRDPLTGLYNRRFMDETLARELSRAKRDDLPIAVLMLDIDHFKQVNDTYGHEAGDLLLKSLAGILLRESRRSDIACRFGGEEFCVIMVGAPLPIARQRAESWRKHFADFSLAYKHHTLRATLSIGIAVYPEHGDTGEDILRVADSALYAAKQAGRNRVEIAPLPTV